MRKIFWMLLIFSSACSILNETELNRIPTGMPGAVNTIIVQTAAVAFTQTAAVIHPSPKLVSTPLPSSTLVASSSTNILTATSTSNCPFTAPYYVRVKPFAVGSKNWNLYIPNYPEDDPNGYPATLFLRHVLNQDAWTLDIETLSLPNYWMNAMAKLNGQGWNYLLSSANGTFFSGSTLDVDTFPGNVLLVMNRKYRRGECWDSISAYPYADTLNAVPDLTSLPPYQLGLQTGMNYSTPSIVYPAPKENGNIYIPILSKHGNLWVEDFSVEPFPDLPMDIIVTANHLDITSDTDSSSLVVETAPNGTHLTLTDYSPTQRNSFGKVINPATGNTGYISLYNWSAYMTGSYTTTWTMQTLPVPPG